MIDIPHCTGCGEYPGDLVTDRIEELEAKLAKAVEALTKIERAYYMEASNPSPKTIRTMAARMNGIARDAQNTISDTKEEGQ